MLAYVVQVVLFQVLFLAVYDLFLSKETFFTKNRFYLLSTAIVSFILPLFRISTLQKSIPQEYSIALPEVVLSPQTIIEKASWYQSINYISILFWIGCLLFLTVFIIKLSKIIQLILTHEKINKKGYKLIFLPNNSKAFSFFNYVFIGKEISEEKKAEIIAHELVHSKQRHTIDLLVFELLKIVMWFNPVLYLYQHRISLVHEYISDEIVSKSTEKTNYINSLLSEIFQVAHISFVNQFYKHSFIKKRIIMMTKNRSKQMKQAKYLLLIPLLASMFLYTACSDNDTLDRTIELNETSRKISLNNRGENINFIFRDYHWLMKDKGNNRISIYDEIPLSMVGAFPIYPGCNEGDRDCFNSKIKEFVNNNFDFTLPSKLNLPRGSYDVYVGFKITKQGNVADVHVKKPFPPQALSDHAMNMVKKLPKMKPGKKNGKAVNVLYTLPIILSVK